MGYKKFPENRVELIIFPNDASEVTVCVEKAGLPEKSDGELKWAVTVLKVWSNGVGLLDRTGEPVSKSKVAWIGVGVGAGVGGGVGVGVTGTGVGVGAIGVGVGFGGGVGVGLEVGRVVGVGFCVGFGV